MTENLEELIEKITEYILANSEKNTMLGIERDQCLVMAQEICIRLYQRVLEKWKESKGKTIND